MAKVGLPFLRLDRLDHFDKEKNKHTGNCRAVILEGLEERLSSDPDLDRTKTYLNKYYGVRSGEELVNMLESNAETFTKADKRGIKRHLKPNASIGFAVIVKPDGDYINSLSATDRVKFFDDTYEVVKSMFEARGLIVCTAVVQYDEGNPHMHVYGYDPSYDLGRKFNLKMCDDMNRGYYPKQMRARGWDVEDLPRNYDPEYANTLSDDELIEYKNKCKEKRKKNGKPSKVYKADKEANKILAEANNKAAAILAEANRKIAEANQRLAEAEAKESENEEKENELTNKTGWINAKNRDIKYNQDKINKQLLQLQALRNTLEADRRTFENDRHNYKAKVENELKTAYTAREEHLKQGEEYLEADKKALEAHIKALEDLMKDVSDYQLRQRADALKRRTERLNKMDMPSMTPINNGIGRQYE